MSLRTLSGRGFGGLSTYEQRLQHAQHAREEARQARLDRLLASKPSTAEEWLQIAVLYEQLGYGRRTVEETLRTAELLAHDEELAQRKRQRTQGRYVR